MAEPMSLETASKAVGDLYHLRDHYFELHDMQGATQKAAVVKQKLDETLAVLDTVSNEQKTKAEFLMLRGKVLNVLPSHDPVAEECLAKAVKLDPRLVEAWVCLGEVYWKRGQVEAARNCFLGALNHSKHKVALRNLSMVTRHLGKGAGADMQGNIEESIARAKEAVQLDITDGTSWFVLGNAYLSQFFAGVQSLTVLKQCLSAYQQAEKDVIAISNPDLHYNRATVYEYQEEYELALTGYSRALALDSSFVEPREKQRLLLQHLSQCAELSQTKGRMRSKKLQSLVDGLDVRLGLGPYATGPYKRGGATQREPSSSSHGAGTQADPSGGGESVQLDPVLLDALQPGPNPGKVIVGKVVCSITGAEAVNFAFCLVDKASTCVRVTVYNIAAGWGVKIGDTVAIPEPVLHRVSVMFSEQQFDFASIRVNSPVVLIVNGRKCGKESQAPSVLAIEIRSE